MMANKDLSKLKSKYDNFEMKPKEETPLKKSETKISASKRRFLFKLENELFSEFTSTDWIMYFQKKYQEANGRGYAIVGKKAWSMEHSIYKSLMKDYSPKDIKLLIDFIFDSNQDIMPKLQAGSYLFSAKWIQGVYQSALLWQTGDYKTKAEINKEKYQSSIPEKRNREWIKNDDLIEKTNEPKVLPKRRKKGKITF